MIDNEAGKSFAEMLEEDFAAPENFDPGEQVEALVLRITSAGVFIDIGGKSEGYIERSEFLDDSGELSIKEGDKVKAYFLSASHSEMLFTTKLGAGSASNAHLEEACASGIPVEGVVEKEVKGGFEVKLAGGARGFCPFSQIGLRRVDDPEELTGKSYSFLVTRYEENGRNIVVSRRKLLEEEALRQKEELREKLQVGTVVKGIITSVREFGAFVDIGGLEGLIPVSEIGWGHVEDIHSRLEAGQQVEVAVLKLDWDNDRFSFSLKETLPDPWEEVVSKFPEGSFHTGKVARLTSFGAFVTLVEGVDGLIHISSLAGGRKINHPREVINEGDAVEIRVDQIDREKRRISLSLAAAVRAAEEEVREEEKVQEYINRNTKESSGSMGTLGDLLKKKLSEE